MEKNSFTNNFKIYLTSNIVLALGGIIYSFAISYFILEYTNSPLYFSINLSIMSLGAIIILPFSGVFVDSIDRRKLILIMQAMSSLSLLTLSAYIYFFGFNIIMLFIITAIRSFITPVISNAFDSSLTQLFEKETIQKVLSKLATYETSLYLLGPVIAGIIYGFLSLETMIFIFFVMQTMALFTNFFLKFKDYKKVNSFDKRSVVSLQRRFTTKFSEGIHYIKRSEILRRLIILSVIINAVGAASFSVLPETIMIKELSLDSTSVGIASSVIGIGSLMGSIVLSKIKIINPLNTVRISFFVVSLLLLFFTVPLYIPLSKLSSLIFISMVGLAMAFVFQFINIPLSSYMQRTIDDEYKGRVFSVSGALGTILLPIATVIFGVLYNFEIYFTVNLFSAVVIVLTSLLTLNIKTILSSKEIYNLN